MNSNEKDKRKWLYIIGAIVIIAIILIIIIVSITSKKYKKGVNKKTESNLVNSEFQLFSKNGNLTQFFFESFENYDIFF